MRKILITGGAGFVGRHFVRHFLENGDEVHAVDCIAPLTGAIDPAAGWPLFEPRDFSNFKFFREDCREFFKRVRDTDYEYAAHLAAMVGGRAMIENKPIAVADDLSIDAEYWQWATAAKPAKTLCFSSSAAYPIKYQREDDYVLLQEDMIDFDDDIGMPDMSYGWAKLTCEYLARLAYEKHGLKSVCYRPFSGYGEDQDDSYPFPSICKRALANPGAKVLTVWGSGKQMRDFIHIDDCVAGVIATMDKIDDGNAVNLSTGIYTSFIEFARMAAKLCGYSPEVRGMSHQPAGVYARGGDTRKQIALGFAHKIDFATGVKRALDYYSRYGSSSPIDAASVPLVPEIPSRTVVKTKASPV
jgi:nucleoside-diphosphate-sugar epimerase